MTCTWSVIMCRDALKCSVSMSYVLPFVLACLACSVHWSPRSVGRGAFFWQYPTVSAIKGKKRHKKRPKRHKNRETLRTREKFANSKKRTCQKRGAMVCGVFSLIGVLVGVGVGEVSPLVIEAIYSNQPRRDITKKRHYHHPQRGNTRNLYFFCRLADI